MRVIFCGGGTGGHILPNLAVIEEAERLKAFSKKDILYIGEKGGMEEGMTRAAGISFKGIYCGKMRRYFDMRNFADIFKVPVGIGQAYGIIRRFKPDVVFAKGGYVSVPVVVGAWLARVPVIMHESDVSPGLATRVCGKFAKKMLLSWDGFLCGNGADRIVTGNPIRAWILKGNREKGLKFLGFGRDKPVLLVMGGSTGAQFINEIIWQSLPELLKFCNVAHVTGKGKGGAGALGGYKSFEYLDKELADVYAASNGIVSRAGANSLSEIAALGLPNILIPLPSTGSRGDQLENAELFERHGASVVLRQGGLNVKRFVKTVKNLLSDQKTQSEMKRELKKLSRPDAAKKIVKALVL